MEFENLKLKCECGGKMEKIRTEWKGIEVRGWKCSKCNEEIINPSDAQKALELNPNNKDAKKTVCLALLKGTDKKSCVILDENSNVIEIYKPQ